MSQSSHATVEKISATNRSRVTNARLRGNVSAHALFVDGDGRSPWARRYRDLVGLFCDDAGGLEFLTELRLSLIRRAAALIVECERMENVLADGGKVDIDLLARLSSHTRRLAEAIGIDRVRQNTIPTLTEVAASFGADGHLTEAAKRQRKALAPSIKATMDKAAVEAAGKVEALAATTLAATQKEPASDHASQSTEPKP